MKNLLMSTLDSMDNIFRVMREEFEAHGPRKIVIKAVEESITDSQRAYYWVLCGIIGNELGNTKDEQHAYFKERYLLNIYIKDIENHPEFDGVVDNMRIIKQQCPEQYHSIRRMVIGGVSITTATKENMADLLTEVINMANDNKIRIPAPPRPGMVPDWERQLCVK